MSNRSMRSAALAALAVGALPLVAPAQTGVFYSPPKLLTRGTNTSPVAGKGSVTVKIFVHKNGKPEAPSAVSKSTNPGDNAAALEIARTSTYKPAARDGKPVDAFYTFVLNFAGGDGGASIGDASSNATLRKVAAMERAGNYTGAKSELNAYLKTSPDDTEANTLLGIASAFTDDPTAAAAAFDKAGTVPEKYKALAGRAYANAATAASRANNNDVAATYASKAIELAPSAEGYNVRGMAQYMQKKYDAAIPDLEKARDLAMAQKADSKNLAIIETNLAAAYMGAGQNEKAQAMAKDVQRLDPSNTVIADVLANSYDEKAAALSKAGNRAEAVAQLEAGAAAVPKRAVILYSEAASMLANDPKPDWKRVKAEADKALAADAADGLSNYLAGIALANQSSKKDALVYFTKAQASSKAGSDAEFAKRVEAAIKDTNNLK
ncbi:MAG: hypothetical protein NVSMB64_08210 [Candidatus Velthaea sp.]